MLYNNMKLGDRLAGTFGRVLPLYSTELKERAPHEVAAEQLTTHPKHHALDRRALYFDRTIIVYAHTTAMHATIAAYLPGTQQPFCRWPSENMQGESPFWTSAPL